MTIYTKTGDDGTTGLLGNARIRKDTPRIRACGSVDETNAALGVILAHLTSDSQFVRGWMEAIQSDLFIIGAILATAPSDKSRHAVLAESQIQALETHIDKMEKDLPPLKNFILPQGTPAAAFAYLARAVARRAERDVVALAVGETVAPTVIPYLNRLSDFLFVLARWINNRESGAETAWINPSGTALSPQDMTGDRLHATLQKLESEKERRKTLFEKASSDIQKKKEIADKLFQQNVDQINKDGGKVEKPLRDMDLD